MPKLRTTSFNDEIEMLFLWIDNQSELTYQFGLIDNKGFNFSFKYFFEYKTDKKIITIKDNPEFIGDFYPNKIKNITALIGKNGSGKSITLNYLVDEKLKAVESSYPESLDIVAFLLNDKIYLYSNKLSNLKSDNINDCRQDKKQEVVLKYYKQHFCWDDAEELSNFSILYYSNIFDRNNIVGQNERLFNITTNFLIYKDIEARTNTLPEKITQTEAFFLNETERQLRFVADTEKDLLKIRLPEYIGISFRKIDENSLRKRLTEHIELKEKRKEDKELINYINELDEIFKNLDNRFNILTKKQVPTSNYQEFYTLRSVILNFINTVLVQITDQLTYGQEYQLKFLKAINSFIPIMEIKFFEDFIAKIKRVEESIHKRNRLYFSICSESLIKYYTVLKDCPKFFSDEYPLSYYKFFIQVDDVNFKDFIKSYFNSVSLTGYFEFNLKNLSSGESSMLSLFARFNSIKYELDYNQRIKKNLLILIDEGELYFHPEWQRKFIYLLVNDLPKIFPDKNFQFIITSNCPFIPSDLPSSCVLYYDRNSNGLEIISGYLINKISFANNIHALFQDSFFMEGGLIGEFAKYKIKAIKTRIEEKQFNTIEIRKEIELIAEPILKTKLLEYLFENESLIDKKTRLEEELKKVNKELEK